MCPHGPQAHCTDAPQRYRIVLDDVLGDGARRWFEGSGVRDAGEQTVLDVVAADQSALHGVLRRIHDLHLTLVSVTRIDPSESAHDPHTSP